MVTTETLFALASLPAMLALSLLSNLIERHSVDQDDECCAVERRRAIQWGRHCGRWYFWAELPSWDWRQDFVKRNNWSWHQRVVVWTDDRGWFVWYRPEAA